MSQTLHAIFGITLKELLDICVVLATLAGPILAVWASEYRQRNRQEEERRTSIYNALTTTIANPMHQEHVIALNNVNLVFVREKEDSVRLAWKKHISNLRDLRYKSKDQAVQQQWTHDVNESLIDLLFTMAQSMRLPHSKDDIRKSSYVPDGYHQDELLRRAIAMRIHDVLNNGWPVNVRLVPTSPPEPTDASKQSA